MIHLFGGKIIEKKKKEISPEASWTTGRHRGLEKAGAFIKGPVGAAYQRE